MPRAFCKNGSLLRIEFEGVIYPQNDPKKFAFRIKFLFDKEGKFLMVDLDYF